MRHIAVSIVIRTPVRPIPALQQQHKVENEITCPEYCSYLKTFLLLDSQGRPLWLPYCWGRDRTVSVPGWTEQKPSVQNCHPCRRKCLTQALPWAELTEMSGEIPSQTTLTPGITKHERRLDTLCQLEHCWNDDFCNAGPIKSYSCPSRNAYLPISK